MNDLLKDYSLRKNFAEKRSSVVGGIYDGIEGQTKKSDRYTSFVLRFGGCMSLIDGTTQSTYETTLVISKLFMSDLRFFACTV